MPSIGCLFDGFRSEVQLDQRQGEQLIDQRILAMDCVRDTWKEFSSFCLSEDKHNPSHRLSWEIEHTLTAMLPARAESEHRKRYATLMTTVNRAAHLARGWSRNEAHRCNSCFHNLCTLFSWQGIGIRPSTRRHSIRRGSNSLLLFPVSKFPPAIRRGELQRTISENQWGCCSQSLPEQVPSRKRLSVWREQIR